MIVNEHQIHWNQVLGGLTHEYYAAAQLPEWYFKADPIPNTTGIVAGWRMRG
jgi:hypothetical protein